MVFYRQTEAQRRALEPRARGEHWGRVVSFWSTLRREMREVVWLASIVGGLSVLGVALALAVALAIDGWPVHLLSRV